ncbi:hypothetical protein MB901379_01769 [Mycobacterium basiliense]|uniref:PE-PGRS family protein n=1 Tax=Mycobacterium basiliense TaxID=2094119 RepID=A0A447GCN6_9MYCO|nr:hypothetical protein MB901379_01769 [Mycobacterium basiliense]
MWAGVVATAVIALPAEDADLGAVGPPTITAVITHVGADDPAKDRCNLAGCGPGGPNGGPGAPPGFDCLPRIGCGPGPI